MLTRARRLATLARWLGPWTPDTRAPAAVRVDARHLPPTRPDDRPLRVDVFQPRDARPTGLLLLIPGLHFLGPADPRMARFARVLAAAGLQVWAPYLPDFLALRLAPTLLHDAARALTALLAAPDRPAGLRPGVVSISFGSRVALDLAASPTLGPHLGGLVLFGGYLDWRDAMRFSLTGLAPGAPDLPRDPLNQPVIFLNLLDRLGLPAADQPTLAAAWTRYVHRTWGRPELKHPDRHAAVAADLAAALPAALRDPFLRGCGCAPGALDWALGALDASDARHAWLDPRPLLPRVATPTWVVHGAEDDVIPVTHAAALAAALPPAARARALVTGLYAHTGQAGLAGYARKAPLLAREVRTLLAILSAFDAAASCPDLSDATTT